MIAAPLRSCSHQTNSKVAAGSVSQTFMKKTTHERRLKVAGQPVRQNVIHATTSVKQLSHGHSSPALLNLPQVLPQGFLELSLSFPPCL